LLSDQQARTACGSDNTELRFQPLIFPWEFRQVSDLKQATRKKHPPFTLGPFQKWNQHYIDNTMGNYKGRTNLRQRKRRFAKSERIKALAANKKGTVPLSGPLNRKASGEISAPVAGAGETT
jgi:hypothetical protein